MNAAATHPLRQLDVYRNTWRWMMVLTPGLSLLSHQQASGTIGGC
jgi:hypothetical protein